MKYLFSYILSFLTDGILYIIILLPVYIFFRRLRLKKSLSSAVSVPKEIVKAILFVYLIMLFTQTFIANAGESSVQLIPFHIIIQELKSILRSQRTIGTFIFNIVGNIGVFIPVGMIFAYLLDSDLKKTVLHGLGISVFIEIVQLPLERTTDIDDVILNTAGTAAGYFIFRLLLRTKKRTAAN